MDDYFDIAGVAPDAFLSVLMGGMARAQERYTAKLRTVDEHGNPIELPQIQVLAAGGEG